MRLGSPLVAGLIGAGVAVLAPRPARAEEKPLPESRLGVRTVPILLLSRPDVRAELKLRPDQAASAERTLTGLYLQAAALRGQPDSRAVPARRAIDEAQRRWIDQNLGEEQRHRLAQIDLQWEGPAALASRPALAESLGLSAEQRARIAAAVARRNDQVKRHSPRTPAPARQELERKLAEEVLSALFPEQQDAWKALLGRPMSFRSVASAPAPGTRK